MFGCAPAHPADVLDGFWLWLAPGDDAETASFDGSVAGWPPLGRPPARILAAPLTCAEASVTVGAAACASDRRGGRGCSY